jgi:hypothetical protein
MTITEIRWVVFFAGLGLIWWQLRWLLRAYRRERDRQPEERRSSRVFLLSTALVVFVALATAFGVYAARRLALGALLVVTVIEAAKRRFTED